MICSEPQPQPINENAPKLTKPGYSTRPAMSALQYYTDEQLEAVSNFTIICEGLGEVRFLGATNVKGLDLDNIVDFKSREIAIYPEESSKPPIGEGLNKAAVVTLQQCWRIDRTTGKPVTDERSRRAYERKIRETTAALNAELEEYNAESGIWRFRVRHF